MEEDQAPDRRRRRRWAVVVIAAAAAAIGVAAVVVVAGRGPEERTTDLATIRNDEVVFHDVELATGVVVSRVWRIEGRTLRSRVDVRNRTAVPRWVIYDEILPVALSSRVDAAAIEGRGREDLNESIARFRQELAPGRALRVSYDVRLAGRPSLNDLEAWTEDFARGWDTHLADPALSPVDRDIDGFPDPHDACAGQAGPLDGCPDRDGDGVVDGDDRCPDDAGREAGCPDGDGDAIADADDVCPEEPGPVEGCPDADDDGWSDADDRCPRADGAIEGCPDEDYDGYGDGSDDACVGEPGPVEGCPDSDGDTAADGADQCPTTRGPHTGCPDDAGVRWALFNALDAHIVRLTALPPVYDPDGDQTVENGRGYCADVQASFATLRSELEAAISGPPAGASPETVALARSAAEEATTNISLLDGCLDRDVPFPWEDPASGWVTACELSDALVERVTGQPYECNSTW